MKICHNCGSIGTEETITQIRGSLWITLILLFCYIAPGIIYEIWRRERITRCSSCKSTDFIDTNSPIGKEIYKKYHENKNTKKD